MVHEACIGHKMVEQSFLIYHQEALDNTLHILYDVVMCDSMEGCVIDCLDCGVTRSGGGIRMILLFLKG